MSRVTVPGHTSVVPANLRKVVQDLTEIVKNSEEEIYAMLKECNMDPNETVQRLLYQDTFHEVKRRRDKRKENINKELGEIRTRASRESSAAQGGRGGWGSDRGSGRGGYMLRFSSNSSHGRGQAFNARVNGHALNLKDPMESQGQIKSKATSGSIEPGVPDRGSDFSGQCGNQATMPYFDGTSSTTLRSDASVSLLKSYSQQASKVSDGTESLTEHNTEHGMDFSLVVVQKSDAAEIGKEIMPVPTKTIPAVPNQAVDDSASFGADIDPLISASVAEFTSARASQSLDIADNITQHHGLEGSEFNWRSSSPLKSRESEKSLVVIHEPARSFLVELHNEGMTYKLEKLSITDDNPVVIPPHLQVPEAERIHLNFGSFGDDLNTIHIASHTDDIAKNCDSTEVDTIEAEQLVEQPNTCSSTVSSVVTVEHNSVHTSQPTYPSDAFVSNSDLAISLPSAISPAVSLPDTLKSESLVQESSILPFLPSVHSYTGLGMVPRLASGSQYSFEAPVSQAQDVSRLPNFVSPYSEPVALNYFSPVIRPTSDVDARYSHLVSNATHKYNPGVAMMTGQGLSLSSEAAVSSSVPVVQISQAVGATQAGLTIAQQPVPIHTYPAQPAGVPLSPFANVLGLQYLPSSYGYIPAPYQPSFVGNPGYPQAPGNSYTSAGSSYAPTGAGIKYSLPQYKPGVAVGSAPLSGVGASYGSFGTAAASTAGNPTIMNVPTSGYEDISGPQFKENSLYLPNQQGGEASTLWIQTQPSRDMTGIQNTYYSILGQGQHTGFAHTQPVHAVPAVGYTNLYHQSQSGVAPAIHTLLQQPQAFSAVGPAVSSQSGAYQQPQRGQLSWANTY